MDEQLLFCVSINSSKKRLYGPEWKELDGGKTLIDLFLQVCGTDILGQQVQVLVSRERAFLEAAVVQVYTPLTVLAEKSQSYIQFILKTDNPKLEVRIDFFFIFINSYYRARWKLYPLCPSKILQKHRMRRRDRYRHEVENLRMF